MVRSSGERDAESSQLILGHLVFGPSTSFYEKTEGRK